jgi:hypothetical protein
MIIARFFASLSILFLGFWVTRVNLSPLFSPKEYIETSSLINLWAGIACLLWGAYGTIYYTLAEKSVEKTAIAFNFNKVTMIIGLVISPIFSLLVQNSITTNFEGYIECHSLREISSRFSSRTYAISVEVCESLDTS